MNNDEINLNKLKIKKYLKKIKKYEQKIRDIQGWYEKDDVENNIEYDVKVEMLFLKYYFKQFILPKINPDYHKQHKPDITKYICIKKIKK